MIHSPRRLSPILQNQQEITCIDNVDRGSMTYCKSPRIPRPKTRDESIRDFHRNQWGEESLRQRRGSRSHTTSSERLPRLKKSQLEIRGEMDQDLIRKNTLKLPVPVEESRSSIMSSSSPPSIHTTASSTTSRSTTGANSVMTSYSEQDYQEMDQLSPLQQNFSADIMASLQPLPANEVDPNSFDLLSPVPNQHKEHQCYSLETRSDLLFSKEHLQVIFSDPTLLLRFTYFLSINRVSSIPVLVYYLDSMKALKAIGYANAIAASLEPVPGLEFTSKPCAKTYNTELEENSQKAFDYLVQEDLPAYITYVYTHTVNLSIQKRITGTLPSHLREASEGLAEVFCMSDPSRPDTPIIFTSEEFHRTTQYGNLYAIGRNCRFLQGPKTNPLSIKRFREKIQAGLEHSEVILNYRRDGSPFMNLVMCAPLCDSKGKIRYYLGAQVDVSGLVNECSELESLKRLVAKVEGKDSSSLMENEYEDGVKDEFQELSEMLNLQEIDTVRRCGGKIHKDSPDYTSEGLGNWAKPRLLINPTSPSLAEAPERLSSERFGSKLQSIYENYLLVRPYPSMYILFASPSLRVPGILQSSFMMKIGGSQRVRDELVRAFAEGNGVTAKVKWVSKCDPEGRNRWIHCTPLFGADGMIGVWMVVIVDDESPSSKRMNRMAPPVDPQIGRYHTSSPMINTRRDNSGSSSRYGTSIREGSLHSVPDSPFSSATFDLSK